MPVDETRIAFPSRVRYKTFSAMAVATLAMGGAAGLSYVAAALNGHSAGGWFLVGMWVVMWLPALYYTVNRMLGVTVLSGNGMRFRTLASRRFIQWGQIVKIEVRTRTGRGGSWQVVRVHRRSGRPLVMPGVMRSQRGDSAADIEEKVRAICSDWEQATGHAESPAYTGVGF